MLHVPRILTVRVAVAVLIVTKSDAKSGKEPRQRIDSGNDQNRWRRAVRSSPSRCRVDSRTFGWARRAAPE